MTSLYFNLQGRLAQLRSTGELLAGDYGRDVGPDEYRQVLGDVSRPNDGRKVDDRLKNLLISKRLYAARKLPITYRRAL